MSSIDEARAVGVSVDEVVKTLVLDTTGGHVLMVLLANERLDLGLAQRAVGDSRAHLAAEWELGSDFPQFELGAIPPLQSLLGCPAYVDPEVMEHVTVVFAAGSHTQSVKMPTAALFGDQEITITSLSRRPNHDDF